MFNINVMILYNIIYIINNKVNIMSNCKVSSFDDIVQTINPIFQEEFEHQQTTNQALVTLNTKVDNTIQAILKDPSIKESIPETIKEISSSITEESTSLIKKTDNLKNLKTNLKEAIAHTKRAPLDPASLETIAYLDPKLADQVNTLFTKAMENHKRLNKNYNDLQKLSQEQQNTIKRLQSNIRILNTTVQGKGWLPAITEKISSLFKAISKKHVTFDLTKNTERRFLATNPANTPSISLGKADVAKPSINQPVDATTSNTPSISLDEADVAEPSINQPVDATASNTPSISLDEADVAEPSINQPVDATASNTPSTATCRVTRSRSKKNKISDREIKNLEIDPTLNLAAPRTTRSANKVF